MEPEIDIEGQIEVAKADGDLTVDQYLLLKLLARIEVDLENISRANWN